MQRQWLAALVLLVSLATLLPGCADPVSPEGADARLYTTLLPADDWLRVHRLRFGAPTGFSFAVPPGFHKLDLQPIDSDAAVYARGEASIHYDFGFYTAAPSADGSDAARKRMRIGGRTAIVVSYRQPDGLYVVKAWWANVSQGPTSPYHLLMVATFGNTQDRPELLASIHSVRFE